MNTFSHSVFYWITWLFVLIGYLPDQTNFLNFSPSFILKYYSHSMTISQMVLPYFWLRTFWMLVHPKPFSATRLLPLCPHQKSLRPLVFLLVINSHICMHGWTSCLPNMEHLVDQTILIDRQFVKHETIDIYNICNDLKRITST
jgi:hypothetical protein